MADVAAAIENWSTTASSNLPADATTIGAGLADNFQQIQATVRAHLASKGADIASATTTDIGAVAGLAHDITGTTTITGLGTVSAGVWKILQFDGALTLTHNGTSLILPGAVNITTAAGDVGVFISEGSGNWRCVSYSGKNIAGNNLVLTGDLAVNGGDLTTSATTFNLLNTTATTVNFAGGASTALNIGNASGTNTVLGATTFSQAGTFSSTLTVGSTFKVNSPTNANGRIAAINGFLELEGAAGAAGIELKNNTSGSYSYLSVEAGDVYQLYAAGTIALYAGATLAGTFASTGLTIPGTLGVTTGAAVGGATPGTGGLAFPATAVAVADPNTLDDYEEGTWTPVGNGITFSSATGIYTKVGRKVTVQFDVTWPSTADAGSSEFTGLPFAANANNYGLSIALTIGYATAYTLLVASSASRVEPRSLAGANITNATLSTVRIIGSGSYFV